MEEFIRQRLGKTVGERWLLQSLLGTGGMAAVYAATDPAGNEAAVKILHPEIGSRKELRERFLREGAVANRIQHPGAVRVLEQGTTEDGSAFLALERLHGESVGERLARDGTLPLPELLDVLEQVLDVLVAAHDAGIVHRDLKPDNLFLTDDDRVKVLDFGIARLLEGAPDEVRTRTGVAMGTLPYMAPEQALGKRGEIDGRVDVFALGATAFRILTKRRIHEASSEAELLLAMATKAAPPLRSVAEHVPENVAAIIDVALAFDRDARYPDARTMLEDVRAVQRAEAPPHASARLRARDEPTRQGTKLRAALPTPTVVARPSALAASAVTPAPAPAPWNTARPTDPETLPRVNAPPLAAPAPSQPLPHSVPPWLVAVGAVGCLLLGALLWLIWPKSEPAQLDHEVQDPSESAEPSEAAREHGKKPPEKARGRERKKSKRDD